MGQDAPPRPEICRALSRIRSHLPNLKTQVDFKLEWAEFAEEVLKTREAQVHALLQDRKTALDLLDGCETALAIGQRNLIRAMRIDGKHGDLNFVADNSYLPVAPHFPFVLHCEGQTRNDYAHGTACSRLERYDTALSHFERAFHMGRMIGMAIDFSLLDLLQMRQARDGCRYKHIPVLIETLDEVSTRTEFYVRHYVDQVIVSHVVSCPHHPQIAALLKHVDPETAVLLKAYLEVFHRHIHVLPPLEHGKNLSAMVHAYYHALNALEARSVAFIRDAKASTEKLGEALSHYYGEGDSGVSQFMLVLKHAYYVLQQNYDLWASSEANLKESSSPLMQLLAVMSLLERAHEFPEDLTGVDAAGVLEKFYGESEAESSVLLRFFCLIFPNAAMALGQLGHGPYWLRDQLTRVVLLREHTIVFMGREKEAANSELVISESLIGNSLNGSLRSNLHRTRQQIQAFGPHGVALSEVYESITQVLTV